MRLGLLRLARVRFTRLRLACIWFTWLRLSGVGLGLRRLAWLRLTIWCCGLLSQLLLHGLLRLLHGLKRRRHIVLCELLCSLLCGLLCLIERGRGRLCGWLSLLHLLKTVGDLLLLLLQRLHLRRGLKLVHRLINVLLRLIELLRGIGHRLLIGFLLLIELRLQRVNPVFESVLRLD